MAQLIARVSLAVGAISYAGQFNIMVVSDPEAYPDLDIFAAGVQEDLRALVARTSAEPRPARGLS